MSTNFTKEIIQAAFTFLGRVDLKGIEVPMFVKVNNALQAELNEVELAQALEHLPKE